MWFNDKNDFAGESKMMRCLTFRSQLVLWLLVWLPGAVIHAAQESKTPKRIELKAGGPAVILEGEVRKDKEVVYVFSAKAGQKFSGRLIKKANNSGFAVSDPDGKGLPEEENDFNTILRGSLEKTGDYRITVSSFEVRDSKYSLSVRITEK
jgi:hypothetical protein